jgi:hypothetical protein
LENEFIEPRIWEDIGNKPKSKSQSPFDGISTQKPIESVCSFHPNGP